MFNAKIYVKADAREYFGEDRGKIIMIAREIMARIFLSTCKVVSDAHCYYRAYASYPLFIRQSFLNSNCNEKHRYICWPIQNWPVLDLTSHMTMHQRLLFILYLSPTSSFYLNLTSKTHGLYFCYNHYFIHTATLWRIDEGCYTDVTRTQCMSSMTIMPWMSATGTVSCCSIRQFYPMSAEPSQLLSCASDLLMLIGLELVLKEVKGCIVKLERWIVHTSLT